MSGQQEVFRKPTALSIAFEPELVDIAGPSGTVKITVTMGPRTAGELIQLYVSKGSRNGLWTLVGEGFTDRGQVVIFWTPTETGTYYFRAEFAGSDLFYPSSEISAYSLTVVPEFSSSRYPFSLGIILLGLLLLLVVVRRGGRVFWER